MQAVGSTSDEAPFLRFVSPLDSSILDAGRFVLRKLQSPKKASALLNMHRAAKYPYQERDCLFFQSSPFVHVAAIYFEPEGGPARPVSNLRLNGHGHGHTDSAIVTGGENEYERGTLVGTIVISFYETFTTIGSLIVSERFRGCGFGKALLDWAFIAHERDVFGTTLRHNYRRPLQALQASKPDFTARPSAVFAVATDVARPLYGRFGFRDVGYISHLRLPCSQLEPLLKRQGAPIHRGESIISFFFKDLIYVTAEHEGISRGTQDLDDILPTGPESFEQYLLAKALTMADEASSCKRGMLTLDFLADAAVHMIIAEAEEEPPGDTDGEDDDEEESDWGSEMDEDELPPHTVLAWCAIRSSTPHDRHIGPVIARSQALAYRLIIGAMAQQFRLEESTDVVLKGLSKSSESYDFMLISDEHHFTISLDSRCGHLQQLEKHLRRAGFGLAARHKVIRTDLGPTAQETQDEPQATSEASAPPKQYAMIDLALS